MLALGLPREVAVPAGPASTLRVPGPADTFIGRDLVLNGPSAFEAELSRLILGWPWTPGLFVDAGANIGLFAGLAARRFGPQTRVIAIEPLPANIAKIERLKTVNGLTFEILPGVLHGQSGSTAELQIPTRGAGRETIATIVDRFGQGKVFAGRDVARMTVPAHALDAVIVPATGPVFVKMDIEGAELEVLEAAAQSLLRRDLDLVVEITMNDPTKERLFELLRRHGYDAYLLTTAGLVAEDRPLTIPTADRADRTLWRNHLFTRRAPEAMRVLSQEIFGRFI